MIRTIEMPILHCEIAEFLDPRIHEAAPGTPSFALHGFRIDDREYVMDCLPTTILDGLDMLECLSTRYSGYYTEEQVNTMFDAIRKKVDEAEKGFRTNGKTKLFSFSDEPTSCGEWTVKAGERIGISLKVINDCNMSVAPNKLEVETFPDGSEPTYYELFNSEGMLCCCDGEVVTVVRTGVDENGVAAAWLYATDSNGETGPEFSLPIEALKVGVFR